MIGNFIWVGLQILIGFNLIFPLLLFLAWKLFSKKAQTWNRSLAPENDYAIIVTAYQETQMIPAVLESILFLDYSNYIVYVVADNCDEYAKLDFDDPRVKILRPPSVLANNTLSHLYAVNNFIRKHTHITIIDSDNLLHPEYLKQLDIFFNNGFFAVQGIRQAKNTDTVIAQLDAIRDVYYHFYDGRILFDLGSSATLSGSGMGFSSDLYREFLSNTKIEGAGFDKVLQNFILKKNLRIAFAPNSIVFDEKTSRKDQLVNQRSRWINTWFKYFKFGFGLLYLGIRNQSLNQFLFGLVLLRPPLFIFLILSGMCLVVNFWIGNVGLLIWLVGFILFILSFAIALFKAKPEKKLYRALLNIPQFIILQLISLFKSKNANQKSVATHHYYTKNTQSPKK